MKLVIDIEANELYHKVTDIFIISTLNIDTGETISYSDHDPTLPSLDDAFEYLTTAEQLIGHNIVRYDLPVIEKVLGWTFSLDKCYDTMIMSKLNWFPRKTTYGRHSLKAWGNFLGTHKGEFNEFGKYSTEMKEYCEQDLQVTYQVYQVLEKERKSITRASAHRKVTYDTAIKLEHEISYWSAKQISNGWKVDKEGLWSLIEKIGEEIYEIEERVEPKLGDMEILIDKEPKTPRYTKNGNYTQATARMLSEWKGDYVDISDAHKETPPIKPGEEFQRKQTVKARLGNQEHLKEFLYKIGWTPDDWNWKKVGGEFVKVSPKLTTKSLTALGDIGVDIDMYFTLRARKSILEGWLDAIDERDDRLYGDVVDLGAASGRQTHKIIANIPSPKAKYGKEIRELMKSEPEKTLISADGASYQARIMAHFVGDEEFTQEILAGDIHQKNADAIGCSRDKAKPFFFAWAFGAGGAKLGRILGVSAKEGAEAKDKFLARWPQLADLTAKVQGAAERGYIKAIDGRRLYAPEAYKAFNYLIQGTEAILMKATVVKINEQFQQDNIKANQLLFYHDECTWELEDPGQVKEAESIIKHWFEEAPKLYGVTIMEAGDIKSGNTYMEVH
jgi:DNA polymerase I-like protein with 3'-5' exonuclease and polymerase domains